MEPDKIKLILADRSEILAMGLAKLLEPNEEIEIICVCRTVSQAVESAINSQPDVILIYSELCDSSGIDAIKFIHERLPKVNIVVLTGSEMAENIFAVIGAGAKAYVYKDVSISNLIKIVSLVANGEVVITQPMAASMLSEFKDLESKRLDERIKLSLREKEVLRLVAKGATNKEVANTLFICENTVKVHMRNILDKLQVHNRQQASALATEKKFFQ